MEGINLIELINDGWIATYPLILFSVLTIAILAERMFVLNNIVSSIRELTQKVLTHLNSGDFDSALSICQGKDKSLPAKIYGPILSTDNVRELSEISDKLDQKRFEEVHNLKRNVWVLGTIGSSAPFIGLLGTVIGIIKSFHNMAVVGTGGFSVVAAGISEALVATAAGLAVAIVAVIAYNYLQTKMGNINTEIRINSAKFLEAYKQGRRANGAREIRREVG